MKKLKLPLSDEQINGLRAGDSVLLSGVVYTARDAAHKRLMEIIENGEELPFDMKDSAVYYLGPTPARPGHHIGSAGPTSSYRMDPYSVPLMKLGLKVMIGKGERGEEMIKAIKKYNAVYFAATGGAAALLSKTVHSSKVIAFEDLGTEAIRRLVLKDFPAIVAIDSRGKDQYQAGPAEFMEKRY